MRSMCRLGLSLAILVCVIKSSQAAAVRGIQPELAASYASIDGSFRCIGDSKLIRLDQVNDGYCDCLDGSDEPGKAVLIAAMAQIFH